MTLNLEEWEVDMVLTGLAQLPYEESAATIYRIRLQVDPDIICCRDCEMFAPLEECPEAEAFHKFLQDLFDLAQKAGETGVCRRKPFCFKIPRLTNELNSCRKAQRRKADE